jgi:hypothetical protein
MAEEYDIQDDLPEEKPNRGFITAVGLIGGLLVVGLACLAVYFLVIAPRQRADQDRAATEAAMQQTLPVLATETGTIPPQQVQPTATATSTATPLPSTATPASTDTPLPLTATAAALATQLAAQAQTPSPTALPATGFAEDVGIPVLLIAAAILIAVIFAVRQLRLRAAG